MKIERAKAEESQVDRQLESGAKAAMIQKAITNTATESAGQGTFAKLLDARRPDIDAERKDKTSDKTETDSSVEHSGESKDGENVDLKKVDRDGRESSGENDGSDSSGGFVAQVPVVEMSKDAAAVPPARSILHIADLERIVSAVRADSFANTKQVTIDLKNSVLDGLRIRLTVSEQGDLKAELLALSEQVKKQLDARRNELESILKDRSIKFSELSVKLVTPDEEQAYVERNAST